MGGEQEHELVGIFAPPVAKSTSGDPTAQAFDERDQYTMTDDEQRLARLIRQRFTYLMASGHSAYITKAGHCQQFVEGDQWESTDRAALCAVGRPAVTMNLVLPMVEYVVGDQIQQRTDTVFRARNGGADEKLASTITKVINQIYDNNQMEWERSDLFNDGVVTGRGFLDARMDYEDNDNGEVRITCLDPKSVLIDPRASRYDPTTWDDVLTVTRMNVDELAVLYGAARAETLRNPSNPVYDDQYALHLGAFGADDNFAPAEYEAVEGNELQRLRPSVLVIERQYYRLTKRQMFLHQTTGDLRPVPTHYTEAMVEARLKANPDLTVVERSRRRIRWSVIAGDTLLYDEWSPYDYFTVIPFFPYFSHGSTIGKVENLLDPQRVFNKANSQELHVLSSTANSGWIVRSGALTNMTLSELEENGAKTGLVIEVNELDAIQKIQPNQVPTGIDRVAYKAKDMITQISGVSDYMLGQAREDVSAKSVEANQRSGSTGLAKLLDNLRRSDYILARHVLSMVQAFYTDQRVLRITTRKDPNASQEVLTINQVSAEGVLNDVTMGEYDIVVTQAPNRDIVEDTEFEQAARMRGELGVNIPDDYLISTSRLRDKMAVQESISQVSNSEQAKAQAELAQRLQMAEVAKVEAEAKLKEADAQLKQVQATAQGDNSAEMAKLQGQLEIERMKADAEMQLAERKLQHEMQLQAQKTAADIAIKHKEAQQKALQDRIAVAQQPKPAAKPTSTP